MLPVCTICLFVSFFLFFLVLIFHVHVHVNIKVLALQCASTEAVQQCGKLDV